MVTVNGYGYGEFGMDSIRMLSRLPGGGISTFLLYKPAALEGGTRTTNYLPWSYTSR